MLGKLKKGQEYVSAKHFIQNRNLNNVPETWVKFTVNILPS